MFEYTKVLRLGKTAVFAIIVCALIGLIINATYVLQAFVMSQIFNNLFVEAPFQIVFKLLVALLIILAARPLLLLAKELAVYKVGVGVKDYTRTQMLLKLKDMGPFAMTKNRSGNIQSTLTDGVEYLEPYFGRYVPQIFVSAVMVVVTGILLLNVDVTVGVVAIVAAIMAAIIPAVWDSTLTRLGFNNWEMYQILNSEIIDSTQGMTTLSLFNAVETRRTQMNAAAEHLLRATMSQMKISLLRSGISTFFVMLGPAASLLAAVIQIQRDILSIDSLFWVLFLSFEVFRPFQDLAASWHFGFMGRASGGAAVELLDNPVTIIQPDEEKHKPESSDIVFRNVSYCYPQSEHEVLHSINFTIHAGSSLGIVGESGSGKTTILGLLMRFDDPKSGSIQIGGVNLADLTEKQRVNLISYVPQEPILFTGTIRDNLLIAAPQTTESDMLDIVRRLKLYDIAPLDTLLDAQVGERGARVSGGQRQRIAIARAMLRKTPIIVFDEATSSLDGGTEDSVHATLEHVRNDCTNNGLIPPTLIQVAHRLPTIQHANQIIVINNGQLIEYGTHQELIRQRGHYWSMYKAGATKKVNEK